MTKPIAIIGWRLQNAVTSVLLAVLLLGASASFGSSWQSSEDFGQSSVEGLTEPASVQSTESQRPNHALTTVPRQRVAGDISKQGKLKHSISPNSVATRNFGTPAAIVRQRLAVTDQSVTYLSFRLSRPGGRAPPASA